MRGSLERGARQAVEVCLGLKGNEKFTIITDQQTLEIANALQKTASAITKDIDFFVLEDFGERPLQSLPLEIEKSLKSADASFLVIQKIGNEVHTIRKPVRLLGTAYGRHVNMPGATKRVFETGLSADHKEVWKFSERVYNILRKCSEIRVESDSGTCLALKFSRQMSWINSNGDMRKRNHLGTNLPGAEVYTCPENVSGTFVADVELGDYFTDKYGFLTEAPLVLKIDNGRVSSLSCENKNLEEDLSAYIKTDANASRIGEFALGTNPFLKEFIGVFLQDEKVPGVHIALGNPYPEVTGARFSSQVHLDCITGKPDVWVDGEKIMEKGRYVF